MRRIIFILGLLLLITPITSSLGGTGAVHTELVYLTEDFKPFSYYDNGRLTGFSVELLRMIWKEAGMHPGNINMYPWARGYKQLLSGPHTVLFTTARIKERENLCKWVCPITDGEKSVFIARKDRKLNIDSFDDAASYLIGTIRLDFVEQLILKMGVNPENVDPVSKMKFNIKKINTSRIDLIAYTEHSFYEIAEEIGYDPDDYETVFLISEVIPCFAFSNDIPDSVIDTFQSALDVVRKNPRYPAMLSEFNLDK